ncbi:MAG: 4-hydroxyphenylacetate 3-hydroxylase [Sphingomonadaceae bacterium]|nr:4-hydroxyphenylacetate 3-hydroxylase [Sphingomonadaceae bacterium]
MRTGAQFLASIKNDGRRVYHDGEMITDVTTHPAFREAARSIARLFDVASDPANRELMTYTSPTTGKPVNRIWQIPYSIEDLNLRRSALERWSEETLGFMGRSPDHVAQFFMGFATDIETMSRGGANPYAENIIPFYEFARDNDAYITYTIVPPQIDRSKPAHQQDPSDSYAGVVEERADGIVIRGAQMLGTGAVFSDYIHLSTIHPMQSGDEPYAISVVIPVNAPGVKLYSRRSYAAGANSLFDYPLASRFDETDCLLVYDDVFVPWEHVFAYRDLEVVRDQWWKTPAHVFGNNQAQTRFVTKLRFLIGLAYRIVKMNGGLNAPPIQQRLAELAIMCGTYEGLLDGQIAKAKPNHNGVYVPDRQIMYSAMNQQSIMYPQILDIIRDLAGGGMIQLPSSVNDFANPEMAADIRKYVRSPNVKADDRVKFMKLAWDAIGSEFASRHDQYEKFYAGAPFIVKMHLYRNYDFKKAESLVDKALSGYGMNGRCVDLNLAENSADGICPDCSCGMR